MDERIGGHGLVARAVGAAALQTSVYEEVEADTGATVQAAMVVGAAGLAAAIAGSAQGTTGIVAGLVNAFVSWLVWAGATNIVGTRLFGGTADWGELLRTLGFAQAPGVLLVLAVVPILGWLVSLVVGIWLLIAGVVAIRQALDIGTGKAIITALVAAIALWLIAAVVAAVFNVSVGAFGALGQA